MKKQRKLQIKNGILCCFLLCTALLFSLNPTLRPVRASRSSAALEKIYIPDRLESVYVPPVFRETETAPTEEIEDISDEREVTCLIFIQPPTGATEGAVGELGMDIRTGELYKCISVSDTEFVWERLSTPSVVQTPGSSDSGDFSAQENALSEDSANAIAYQYDRNLLNLVGVNWSEVDVITLNYGTNDYTAGTSLELFRNSAIENMGKIMEKYPHITFVLITPTWRFWYNADGTFLEDSNTRVIAGNTLPDFCEASAEIATDLNIPLINAQDIGINRFNFKNYFPTNELDGTHHSVEGRERLARYLAAQLMSIL